MRIRCSKAFCLLTDNLLLDEFIAFLVFEKCVLFAGLLRTYDTSHPDYPDTKGDESFYFLLSSLYVRVAFTLYWQI